MRSIKLLSLLAVAAAPALLASPCTTNSLSNYLLLSPITGCALGPYNVKDWMFTVITSTNGITASDIQVSPTAGGGVYTFDFTSPTGKFIAGPADTIKFEVDYFWDPGPWQGLDEVMNDPVTSPGLSQLTVNACENGNFPCGGSTFSLLLQATNPSQTHVTAAHVFPPGVVTTLGIQDLVEIDGNSCTPPIGSSVCADITNFTDISAPEPSALILSLLPAGAAFFLRRKLRLHPR
jgi:hypothetical protein